MFKRGLSQLYRFFSLENRPGLAGMAATRVYSLYLYHVNDPFSDELLWDYNSALGDGTVGEFDGKRLPEWRLRAALRHYPAPEDTTEDASTQRLLPKKQFFSDVIIWIPEVLWETRVREERGKPAERLLTNLKEQHFKEFKSQLWKGRSPRYCLMPDPTLKEGELVCQFGTDIFVPDANDKPLRHVAVYNDEGGEYLVPELQFWKDGKLTTRPLGWYEAQHALQLSPDSHISRPPLPFWLEGLPVEGNSIRLRQEPVQGVDNKFFFEAKLGGISPRISTRRGGLEQEYAFLSSGQSLNLVIQSTEVDQIMSPSGETTTQTTYIPVIGEPSLVLKGLALRPLMDTMLNLRGAAGWQFFLDDQNSVSGSESLLKVFGYTGEKSVYVQYAGRAAEQLDVPCELEVGLSHYRFEWFGDTQSNNIHLHLDESQPSHDSIPLSESVGELPKTYRLGRKPKADVKEGEEALPMRVLDVTGTVFQQDGSPLMLHGQAATLGPTLSGNQVDLRLESGKLWVIQVSHNLHSLLLDKDGSVKKLLPKRKSERQPGSRGVLEPGEYLWVGPYIFQFVDPKGVV